MEEILVLWIKVLLVCVVIMCLEGPGSLRYRSQRLRINKNTDKNPSRAL